MPLKEFIEIHAAGNGHRKPAFSKAKEPKGKFRILYYGRQFYRDFWANFT